MAPHMSNPSTPVSCDTSPPGNTTEYGQLHVMSAFTPKPSGWQLLIPKGNTYFYGGMKFGGTVTFFTWCSRLAFVVMKEYTGTLSICLTPWTVKFADANNSSAGQNFPLFIWKSKAYLHIHETHHWTVAVAIWIYLMLSLSFLLFILILSLYLRPVPPRRACPLRFPTKFVRILYLSLPSPHPRLDHHNTSSWRKHLADSHWLIFSNLRNIST